MSLDEEVDICIWKHMANYENSATFQLIDEKHGLYNCLNCSGEYMSCEYYKTNKASALNMKYGKMQT